MADDYEARIANIEAHRARRVAQLFVQEREPEFEGKPTDQIVNLAGIDAKDVVAKFTAKQEKFGTTPFDTTGDAFRLAPGGITIWSGFPGAGKTTLLRQFICHSLKRGSSVFLATFEEDPMDALCRIAATAAGKDIPEYADLAWFLDAYGERFKLWGVIGMARHRELLGVIRKLATQGTRHAIIDSLMCLDVSNTDLEAQRDFAATMAATAKASNVHIHLVAHPRKLVSADQEPDLNDIAGAREIGAVADNVIFVRRSKGEAVSVTTEVTPMVVAIRKQRHFHGHLGTVTGWYNRKFRQFTPDQFQAEPTWYLPDEAKTFR